MDGATITRYCVFLNAESTFQLPTCYMGGIVRVAAVGGEMEVVATDGSILACAACIQNRESPSASSHAFSELAKRRVYPPPSKTIKVER